MRTWVRCRACGARKDRGYCVPYGLGWCCDTECRWVAEQSRHARIRGEKPRQTRDLALPVRGDESGKRAKTRTEPSTEAKARIRDRDGGICRWCGSSTDLHVHHIEYRSEGGKHGERNLVTLCGKDHAKVHSSKYRWQPILLELMHQHYDMSRYLTVPQVVALLECTAPDADDPTMDIRNTEKPNSLHVTQIDVGEAVATTPSDSGMLPRSDGDVWDADPIDTPLPPVGGVNQSDHNSSWMKP